MIIIRTSYQTNANGTGQILAKGAGKQRTMQYDPVLSSDANHGQAAGILAIILGLGWSDAIEHDSNDAGTRHGFAWEVK